MNPIDRYIDDVLHSVFASAEDRRRLAADLRAHFAEGEAEARTPRQIIEALGTPEEVAAAFNAERQIYYAGFWQRLVAFIGDFGLFIILTLPIVSVGLLTGVFGEEPKDPPITTLVFFVLVALAWVGILIFYFPLLEARFGKTLGKHLLRLRVVRENGAPIGLGPAFVRRLSLYFDMLVIDALFIPFTDKRQRALDIVAKTVVAREPGESASGWGYVACLLLAVVPTLALLALAILGSPS